MWLQTLNAVLPFDAMAVVIRHSFAPQLVPGSVVPDFLLLTAWTIAGWVGAAWAVGRRR